MVAYEEGNTISVEGKLYKFTSDILMSSEVKTEEEIQFLLEDGYINEVKDALTWNEAETLLKQILLVLSYESGLQYADPCLKEAKDNLEKFRENYFDLLKE